MNYQLSFARYEMTTYGESICWPTLESIGNAWSYGGKGSGLLYCSQRSMLIHWIEAEAGLAEPMRGVAFADQDNPSTDELFLTQFQIFLHQRSS
jgi:hypothetical protein